jgi:hypothetical protein
LRKPQTQADVEPHEHKQGNYRRPARLTEWDPLQTVPRRCSNVSGLGRVQAANGGTCASGLPLLTEMARAASAVAKPYAQRAVCRL